MKITAVEQQILRERFGTVPRGLRAGVDYLLHTDDGATIGVAAAKGSKTKGPGTKKRPRPVAEPPVPPEVLATMDGLDLEAATDPGEPDWMRDTSPASSTPTPHRHRRGEKLNEVYDHGTPIRTYRCAVPGCTTTLTA